ncbi:MAG: phosphomannomutase/phosphoglucomutase [Candidatus Heimdallarchaeota archaeon]|nr:phosphomannomutase/phosphoglucomutase [Candidatus Heimdallarchaeota archaeon]
MSGIFKKNDIRGVYPEQLNEELAEKIGYIFSTYLKPNSAIAIAIDSRLSSNEICDALVIGLNKGGIITYNLGLGPTPLTYFVANMNENIAASIMITASHNPKDWNGIKFCDQDGLAYNFENLYSRLENEIGSIILPKKEIDHKLIRDGALLTFQYFAYLENKFSFKAKLKILVEYGNGSVGNFNQVLEKLGCEVTSFREFPDGNFPTMIPDPTKESTFKFIQDKMKTGEFDIGIAFDGDGDRVGFMLPNGILVSPDKVVMLFSKEIIDRKQSCLTLMDVKMSQASREYIQSQGGSVQLTQTGHSWVHKKLIETQADLAAELSSHYYFEDEYLGFDDGLYAALRFLQIIDISKQRDLDIVDVINQLPSYYSSPEFRESMPKERQDRIVEALKEFTTRLNGSLITIDGIRGEFEYGWFLARKSGTEEALSYRIEGKTKSDFEHLKREVLSIINDN